MSVYWNYLKSLLKHKWYVFRAGRIVGGIPLWRLIVHDWSKFTPAEFGAYARLFFGEKKSPAEKVQEDGDRQWDAKRLKEERKRDFDFAWLHHQNTNSHHWQYWIVMYAKEADQIRALEMPETYVREMVADWLGASMTYTGSWDMSEWLTKNGPRTILHRRTRALTHQILSELGYTFVPGEFWRVRAFVPHFQEELIV